MKNHFAVGTDEMTIHEQKRFIEFLDENELSWWHWVDGFWLVVDDRQEFTSSKLRNAIMKIAPKKMNFVLMVERVESPEWACYGSTEQNEETSRWITQTWFDD